MLASAGKVVEEVLRDYRKLAGTPEGRDRIAIALTGKHWTELQQKEQVALGNALDRMAAKTFLPQVAIASTGTGVGSLPSNVKGAYAAQQNLIILARGLNKDDLLATIREEVGEAIAATAAKELGAMSKAAKGDAGARLASVLKGEPIQAADFEDSPSDHVRLVIDGREVTAAAKASNQPPAVPKEIAGVNPGDAIVLKGGLWKEIGKSKYAADLGKLLAPKIAKGLDKSKVVEIANWVLQGQSATYIEDKPEFAKLARRNEYFNSAMELLGISNRQIKLLTRDSAYGGIDSLIKNLVGTKVGPYTREQFNMLNTALKMRYSIDDSADSQLRAYIANKPRAGLRKGFTPYEMSMNGAIDAVRSLKPFKGVISPEMFARDILYRRNYSPFNKHGEVRHGIDVKVSGTVEVRKALLEHFPISADDTAYLDQLIKKTGLTYKYHDRQTSDQLTRRFLRELYAAIPDEKHGGLSRDSRAYVANKVATDVLQYLTGVTVVGTRLTLYYGGISVAGIQQKIDAAMSHAQATLGTKFSANIMNSVTMTALGIGGLYWSSMITAAAASNFQGNSTVDGALERAGKAMSGTNLGVTTAALASYEALVAPYGLTRTIATYATPVLFGLGDITGGITSIIDTKIAADAKKKTPTQAALLYAGAGTRIFFGMFPLIAAGRQAINTQHQQTPESKLLGPASGLAAWLLFRFAADTLPYVFKGKKKGGGGSGTDTGNS